MITKKFPSDPPNIVSLAPRSSSPDVCRWGPLKIRKFKHGKGASRVATSLRITVYEGARVQIANRRPLSSVIDTGSVGLTPGRPTCFKCVLFDTKFR